MLRIVISQVELKQKSPHYNKGHIAKCPAQHGWAGLWGDGDQPCVVTGAGTDGLRGLKWGPGQGAEPWQGVREISHGIWVSAEL